MAKGPFGFLPVYTLDFGTVSVQAHISKKRDLAAQIAGLQTETKELVAQCHNPKAGSPLIQHGMKATVSPSWDGLEGIFTVTGEPDSDPFAVTSALGRVYYGTFEQSADSVDDSEGWEVWEKRRKVEVDTGSAAQAPEVQWVREPVRLKFVSQSGSNYDEYGRQKLTVIALRGSFMERDILASEARSVNPEVWEVIPEGEYERAELRA